MIYIFFIFMLRGKFIFSLYMIVGFRVRLKQVFKVSKMDQFEKGFVSKFISLNLILGFYILGEN